MLKVAEPRFAGNEKKYLCQAIDEGEVSSTGKFVRRFEEAFAKWSGNEYAIAVSSGTAALEAAIWALGLKEISIPSGTIIACVLAATRVQAKVRFHDNVTVSKDSIMRCHLFGSFDASRGFHVVDDLSQYWVPYRVQDVGCYSLYANKLITSGEGGVVVTNRKDIAERVRYYRNLCHSEERFIHYDMGYNFRMSNIQAAVALAQLEQIDEFTALKQKVRDLYLKHLPAEIGSLFSVKVPWMYLVKTRHDAGEIVLDMAKLGVECRRFFYPLHRQPCAKVRSGEQFPLADALWRNTFYLPSSPNLNEGDVAHVCDTLRSIL